MASFETAKPNNGLVLLYKAAMVLEQQSMKETRMVFPITSIANRPMAFQVSVAMGQRYATKLDVPTVTLQAVHLPVTALARRNSPTSRSSHNELEKTRRARLRHCLDLLRDLLPLNHGEPSRMSMLNVLKKSCMHLKELETLINSQRAQLRQVERRRIELQLRRAHLMRVWRCIQKRATAAAAAAASNAATANASPPATATATAVAAASVAVVADPDAWRSRNASEISVASGSSDEADLLARPHPEQQHCHQYNLGTAVAGKTASAAVVVIRRCESCDSPDSGYISPQNMASNTS